MDVQSARTFFAYNRWANRRLLKAASKLSAEELDRDLRGSFRSIRGPCGISCGRSARGSDSGGRADLEKAQGAFFDGLNDRKLMARRKVDQDSYVLGELIQHALNHSTHHRGQVVLMLRQLGKTPPGTGFRQFLTASRRRQA